MVDESTLRTVAPSNFSRRKIAPRNSLLSRDRSPFRELARIAAPRKTKEFLVARTGCDGSTAKRWLRGYVAALRGFAGGRATCARNARDLLQAPRWCPRHHSFAAAGKDDQ